MSLTFTITPKGEAAIAYNAISLTNGRQAIDFDAGAPVVHQFRFKSPGVGGQWLIRDLSVARDVRVIVRYMAASVDAAEALYQADCDKFTAKAVQLDSNGITYKGCNVVPSSLRRKSKIKATGRTAGQAYFDVSMSFTQDNPADEA